LNPKWSINTLTFINIGRRILKTGLAKFLASDMIATRPLGQWHLLALSMRGCFSNVEKSLAAPSADTGNSTAESVAGIITNKTP